jgi:hypothetical protein
MWDKCNYCIVMSVLNSVICNAYLNCNETNHGNSPESCRVPVEAALTGFRMALADIRRYNCGSHAIRRAHTRETDK